MTVVTWFCIGKYGVGTSVWYTYQHFSEGCETNITDCPSHANFREDIYRTNKKRAEPSTDRL